jgi:alpha-L-arabinofuranosidase
MPVRFWEIGNEIYLAEPKRDSSIPGNDERIYKTAAQYATAFHAFSSALHKAGADTLVGAIAGTYNTSKENRGWLDTILQQNAAEMDFLSLHNSFAPIITTKYDFSDEHNRNDAYLATYAHAARAGEDIAQVRAALKRSKSAAADRIAITEHFPLFGASNSHDQLLAILDQSRTMAAALYTASLFHVYMRENVWMADYNLALSQWFGALLLDGDHGLVRAPVWHVWDLYRNHFGTELVDVSLQSSTYSTGALGVVEARNNVLLLDAVASKDAGGNYFLAVVNRHPKTPISSTIKLDDAALHPSGLWTLEAKAPNAVNGPSLSPTTQSGDPDSIRIKELSPAPLASGTYIFPPTSVTVVEWSPVREMTNRRMAAREN